MKLNQPKVITWWISVALGVLGLIASFVSIPVLSGIAIWLVAAGLALLALGNLFKGL